METRKRLPTKNFWAMLLVPVLVLLAMGAKPLYTVSVGEEIQLQTVPVDPRDPWYGVYVSLKFEVEEVPESKIEPDVRQMMERQGIVPVYVLLQHNGKSHEISQVTGTRPSKGIYLEGNIVSSLPNQSLDGSIYQIHYPALEQYYVEEGKGRELEQMSQTGQLVATLKVYKGYAILTNLEKKTPE
ncbi:GDYXXLXY domain-containing protein [Risungbinella massiliensis]|uniref:GDYXXLXY domain-containing protein n=1 Tax=Risungbinella massiliensis TaxID=1329796 RepID=UPI0005CBB6B0|nr:GDYXXLXY domain-containing protein [Risungbinella massiliensis]